MSERSSDWVTRVTPERVAEAEARVATTAEVIRGLEDAMFLADFYRSRYERLREETARAARGLEHLGNGGMG